MVTGARFALAAILLTVDLFVVAQSTWAARTQSGSARYYSVGVFATVADNRGMALRGDVDGYAAVTECWRIGQVIKARINGGSLETYQVLDCSHPRHRATHIRQGIVIEVDYASAVRNGFHVHGRAPATVYLP